MDPHKAGFTTRQGLSDFEIDGVAVQASAYRAALRWESQQSETTSLDRKMPLVEGHWKASILHD